MLSKLGMHHQLSCGPAVGMYQKCMNLPEQDPYPGRRIIGRYYFDDAVTNAWCAQGATGARIWWAQVWPWAMARRYMWAICTPNEPQPIDNPTFAAALSEFLSAAVDLAAVDGFRLIGPEISVGNPAGTATERRNIMRILAPGMGRLFGYSYHSYRWQDIAEQYTALRYELLRDDLLSAGAPDRQWYLTEGPVDGGAKWPDPLPGRGWYTRYNGDWQRAKADFCAFDEILCQDPRVECITPFTARAAGNWRDFALSDGQCAELQKWVDSRGGPFVSDNTPPPPPVTPLRDVLLAAGETHQLIQFNPAAALQRAIFQAGFVPNSGEFDVAVSGITYRCQRAERLSDGVVRVYYCPLGQWDDVRYVQR